MKNVLRILRALAYFAIIAGSIVVFCTLKLWNYPGRMPGFNMTANQFTGLCFGVLLCIFAHRFFRSMTK